ncbi:cysteine--tRNA ligase [Candidatus Gracilibacteria bacterium]|nr:cysteine--tRNA ligase [Candidatus Gracilibacteria bacterium]
MQIYNTLTREKEEFKSLKDNAVKIYYCGPTVYNYAHIGNLKTYTGNDVIVRAMKFLGYPVQTTMNITDIDDKTIRDSIAAGEDLKSFTEKYTKEFLSDIEKLNIQRADNIEPISNVIPEMVRMINTMLKRGFAYLSEDGSIYYKIKAFKKYGKLANLDMDSLKEAARTDNDEYEKDSASDFALWKAYDNEKDGENFWEETFIIDGKEQKVKGRPGWHIECSACAMKHFGPQIDIHMGGVDLIFPHHQNEIAQTEACTRKTFSKYWVHHGHLMVDGKKMSKSLGNFYTLRDLEEKFCPHSVSPKGREEAAVLGDKVSLTVLYSAIRLNFINCKYRDSVDLSFEKLEANFTTIKRINETIKNVSRNINIENKNIGISREYREDMQGVMQDFIACLEDDFNMPEALALLFSFQKYVNSGIDGQKFSKEELESIIDMYEQLDEVFGIIDWSVLEESEEEIPENIAKLFEKRNTAKSEKDFELSDKLRDELLEGGWKIIDSREGSRVEKV